MSEAHHPTGGQCSVTWGVRASIGKNSNSLWCSSLSYEKTNNVQLLVLWMSMKMLVQPFPTNCLFKFLFFWTISCSLTFTWSAEDDNAAEQISVPCVSKCPSPLTAVAEREKAPRGVAAAQLFQLAAISPVYKKISSANKNISPAYKNISRACKDISQ